jgi:tetratricopeptide (TPR) repeat protein
MAGSTKEMNCNLRSLRMLLTALACAVLMLPDVAGAQQLDELSLDRWKLLRETERYQLQIAEQLYRERNYKVALSEYEKYLSLYEASEAAAYSQLKWSLCQVHLRKSNTAIKEGFQSVIDYWPDSPEAIAAGYYIGNTYQGMGRIPEAKKVYRELLVDHKEHLAGAYAASGLAAIAATEKDEKTLVEMWRLLTFDTQRTPQCNNVCVTASQQLATYYYSQAAFDEAVKSLATTYAPGEQLADHVMHFLNGPLNQLCSSSDTSTQGEKLAKQAIDWYRQQMPAQTDEATKKLAQKYWFHIAAIQGLARHDAEVPPTYEQIINTFGADDETFSRLAQWYKTRDQYDEARKTYGRYVDKVEGLNQIAYSHRQQSKPELAIAVYNQLLGLDSENQIRWKAEIAATHRAAQQYEQAIAMYEQLVAEDLEKEQSWRWQMATAYQDWGKYPEAIAQYRLCTNFPSNYQNMAWCHRQLKQYNEALILYNQILTHEPSAPWAMLQIGYTHEQAGQKEQAIKSFQIVCKKFPKDAHASQAHAHLQNEYKISVTLGGATDE